MRAVHIFPGAVAPPFLPHSTHPIPLHQCAGEVRAEIGPEGQTPLRMVIKEGKTLKDQYEFLGIRAARQSLSL